MQDYLINLLAKSTKIIVIVTFISVFFALTSLVISINKNYGLNFFIKAEDFTAYYTAAKMIAAGEGNNLYDLNRQMNYQLELTSNIFTFRPFINPPFVALMFLPLVVISLNNAYLIWLIFNLILLILIIKMILSEFMPKAGLRVLIPVILLIAVFPPTFITIISGQMSLILVLSFLMARKSYLSGSKAKAALWLSLLFLKPQYIFLPLIYFAYKKEYKILGIISLVGLLLGLASFLIIGAQGLARYVEFIASILTWQDTNTVVPTLTFSLRGFLQLIFQNNNFGQILVYWILSVILVCVLVIYIWKRKIKETTFKFDTDWSALIIGAALITPYTSGQDITMLIIPAVLMYFWSKHLKLTKNFQNLFLIFLMLGYIITVISGFFVIYLHIQVLVLYLIFSLFILIFILNNKKLSGAK